MFYACSALNLLENYVTGAKCEHTYLNANYEKILFK